MGGMGIGRGNGFEDLTPKVQKALQKGPGVREELEQLRRGKGA